MALYLPRKWSADNSILAIAGVPATSLTRALLEFAGHYRKVPDTSVNGHGPDHSRERSLIWCASIKG